MIEITTANKLREEEIKQIIELGKAGYTCQEIAIKIKRSPDSVRRCLKRHGVYKRKSRIITQNELERIIEDYKSGMRPVFIGKKYNRTPACIINKLKSIGLYVDSRNNLTQDEIAFISECYKRGDMESIQTAFPDMSLASVYIRMSKLGIRSGHKSYWTDEELGFLKDNYYVLSLSDIESHYCGRHTKDAIQSKALKHFGYTKDRNEWSPEEISILKENYARFSMDKVCELLPNRTKNAISLKASYMGLKSNYTLESRWTDGEVEFLRNNWETLSDMEIATELNRNVTSIGDKRSALGLVRVATDGSGYEDLNKYIRGQISKWKEDSMKSCNYKCVLTGAKNFQIHHLCCVSKMITDMFVNNEEIIQEKPFDLYTQQELDLIVSLYLKEQDKYPLGVCLRIDLHKLFHSVYGKRNNNVQQWEQFKEDFKNGKYDNITQTQNNT